MEKQVALQKLDATLKLQSFQEVGPGIADYVGTIDVDGKSIDIRIEIPDLTFATSPRVYLLNLSQIPLETLAHIQTDNGVCFSSGAGLPLDMYAPGESILRVLAEARRTLERSYGRKAERDVIDEYQSYWHPEVPTRIFLEQSDQRQHRDAHLFVARQGGVAKFLALSESATLRGYECEKPLRARLYDISEAIGPSRHVSRPETLRELKEWWNSQGSLANISWSEIFAFLAKRGTIFVAAPNAVVGFNVSIPPDMSEALRTKRIRASILPKLLSQRAGEIRVMRMSGVWCSQKSIASRNTANNRMLSRVKIGLVGCGTIGSHLAKMLVQVGAGIDAQFELYDIQALSQGNIGRHLLGFGDIGKPKAEALAEELKRYHPQLERIVGINCSAISQWERLSKNDLIIDATGEWNVQCALNEFFLNDTRTTLGALLHCWIFMNGAGVQSFLNLRDNHACFRCLKTSFDGPWRYPAGDESDELNLQPASCGDGAFVPFPVNVPAMAAGLTTSAALDWAAGQPGHRMRTTVVDFVRGRFQKPVSPMPLSGCPACAPIRSFA